MPNPPTRDKHEAAIAGAAFLIFKRWKPQILSGAFDAAGFRQDFLSTLAPKFARAYRDALENLTDANDLELLKADYEKASERWADRYSKQLSKEIASDFEQEVNAALRAPDPIEAFKDIGRSGKLSRKRAEVIGITDTTRAFTAGETEAVKRIEKKTGKSLIAIWNTQEDAIVCPLCEPYNLQRRAVWYHRAPLGPPLHVRCRCYLTYILG